MPIFITHGRQRGPPAPCGAVHLSHAGKEGALPYSGVAEGPLGIVTAVQILNRQLDELRVVALEPDSEDGDLLEGFVVEIAPEMLEPCPRRRFGGLSPSCRTGSRYWHLSGSGTADLGKAVPTGAPGEPVGLCEFATNLGLVWRPRRDAALAQLRAEGLPVRDEDVARLSPLGFAHINMLGRYTFVLPEAVARGELRPLRDPSYIGDNQVSDGRPSLGSPLRGPISSRKPPSTAGGASVTSKVAVSMETMPTSRTAVSPTKAVARLLRASALTTAAQAVTPSRRRSGRSRRSRR